jgi:hypothetical protein
MWGFNQLGYLTAFHFSNLDQLVDLVLSDFLRLIFRLVPVKG